LGDAEVLLSRQPPSLSTAELVLVGHVQQQQVVLFHFLEPPAINA